VTAADREELERAVRARCEVGDADGATALALRGYGREILSFLVGVHRDEADADEVFAIFAERLWRGLPKFGWASSLRTWAYAVARNASLTQRASARKRARRFVGLPEGSSLSAIAEQIRSETRSFLKTEAKDGLARLREALGEDDRALLTLRLERGLSWIDLARVLGAAGDDASDEDLSRASAQLRKRFERLKSKIAKLGVREGLVKPRSSG
jgi:RNA polymerase sigma-70 factor (ECF subfamily)